MSKVQQDQEEIRRKEGKEEITRIVHHDVQMSELFDSVFNQLLIT